MVLNPNKIINDAGIYMIVRRGNDDRIEVVNPSAKELAWGEWLKDGRRPTSIKLVIPNQQNTKEITLVDDGEAPWGIQMNGAVGNQRIKVGGRKDFNIRVKKTGENYFLNFECIGGDFDGYNVNANTEFKVNM